MTQKIAIWIEEINGWWCRTTHESIFWPIHGRYRCVTCGRGYPVPWARPELSGADNTIIVSRPQSHESESPVVLF